MPLYSEAVLAAINVVEISHVAVVTFGYGIVALNLEN